MMRKIPKNIFMCHKTVSYIQKYSQNWTRLNPEMKVYLYDDEACIKFLLEKFTKLHCDIFRFIPDGPIKCDFWRVCVLYYYGGIYVDADVEPLIPLKDFVEPGIDFLTCKSYNAGYNPHFMISTPGNIILKNCIDTYVSFYLKKKEYGYWTWSICHIMHISGIGDTEGIYYVGGKKIQLIKENYGNDYYDNNCSYKGIRVLNNRYINYNYEKHTFHN